MLWPRQIFMQYIRCLQDGKSKEKCGKIAAEAITKEHYSVEGMRTIFRVYLSYLKRQKVRFEQSKRRTVEAHIADARKALGNVAPLDRMEIPKNGVT